MESWEKQTAEQAAAPIKEQVKEVLTPPALQNKEKRPNYILRTQIILCLLILLALLTGKKLQLPFFESCRNAFKAGMEQGIDLNAKEELLRFTGAAVEQLQQTALELREDSTELTGAGGEKPAKWPRTPAGYSEKSYVPDFSLNRPISEFYITSEYGWRRHPISRKSDFHTGLDMAAAEGTCISPAAEGIVLKTAYSPSYGNHVVVLHEGGVTTKYCHMQYVFVRTGELAEKDTTLGTVGSTGVATGPHLHFELLHDDVGYDPADALGLK